MNCENYFSLIRYSRINNFDISVLFVVVETAVSDAAAGVLAVQEKLPKEDIKSKVLEAQVIRLSGVKPASVAKLEEQRAIIANNDTKSASKDKAEAVKVDKETTELYA